MEADVRTIRPLLLVAYELEPAGEYRAALGRLLAATAPAEPAVLGLPDKPPRRRRA